MPSESNDAEVELPENYLITFKNGPADDQEHIASLVVTIIGPAESIDSAEEIFSIILGEQLDLLAFSTQSRFKIIGSRQLIEWEEGLKERMFKVFHRVDIKYPPEPAPLNDYLQTIRTLNNAIPAPYVRTALKYFRYGLLELQLEDQFMRFWLALEIIAENSKEKESVPIECISCGKPIKCAECGDEPTRVPMAKQAIEQIVSSITGDKAKAVLRRQFKTRNGLMHGRSRDSIEADCKGSLIDIANELGQITWRAIVEVIPITTTDVLNFAHRGGDFTNGSLVMSTVGSFPHTGDGPHPSDENIPDIKIDLITKPRESAES